MIVTDKKYHLDDNLIKKFDLMAQRCTGNKKFDNLIIVDGDEGYGKSNISVAGAYYLAYKTGRKFDIDHIFFDAEKLIETAKKTQDQVFVFDEAALVALASNWQNKLQQKMITYFMTARKKRHIVFFNIPKFFRLNEYFVLDRAICLIHVYAKDEMELGRFCYYKKVQKNELYDLIKKKGKRQYSKYYSFRGTFPLVIGDCSKKDKYIIDEKEYDIRKDKAIEGIGESSSAGFSRMDKFHIKLKYAIVNYAIKNKIPIKKFARELNVDRNAFYEWKNYPNKYPDVIGNPI